jgi:hypothetical protein
LYFNLQTISQAANLCPPFVNVKASPRGKSIVLYQDQHRL